MTIAPLLLPIALLLGGVLWCAWTVWPVRVVFVDGHIVKRHRFRTEKMALRDLAQILFHYHAAVGFVCAWEFIPITGQSITAEAYGINNRLLARLERHVPGFSAARFHQAFRDGDVADTLEAWRAA